MPPKINYPMILFSFFKVESCSFVTSIMLERVIQKLGVIHSKWSIILAISKTITEFYVSRNPVLQKRVKYLPKVQVCDLFLISSYK